MERYLEFRIDEQTTELKMEAFLKKKSRTYKTADQPGEVSTGRDYQKRSSLSCN